MSPTSLRKGTGGDLHESQIHHTQQRLKIKTVKWGKLYTFYEELIYRCEICECLLVLPVVTVFPRPRMPVVFARLRVTALFRSGAWSRPHLIANDKLPNCKSSVAGDRCKIQTPKLSLPRASGGFIQSSGKFVKERAIFMRSNGSSVRTHLTWGGDMNKTPKQCHPFYQSAWIEFYQ